MPSHRNFTPAGIAHPRVRRFLDIKHNRGPRAATAIALEGLWAVRCAVHASITFEAVFVCPDLVRGDETTAILDLLRAAGVPAFEVSERVLTRMVDRDGPDGLAAIAHIRRVRLDDVVVSPTTRILVADGFELAGNLGTVIRCADGSGAAAVIVTSRQVRLTHPLVMKASMGTMLSTTVIDAERTDAADWLDRRRVRVVAADPSADLSYRDADLRGSVAIVVGSERHGLAPFWSDVADVTVSIPMRGVADSLNVGHAAALLLYEALHQAEREKQR